MSNFTKAEIKALFTELEKLTTNMDIPIFRRADAAWLLRNASINNEDHKNLQKVLKIAKILTGENNG
jgi:hypothetical protein